MGNDRGGGQTADDALEDDATGELKGDVQPILVCMMISISGLPGPVCPFLRSGSIALKPKVSRAFLEKFFRLTSNGRKFERL